LRGTLEVLAERQADLTAQASFAVASELGQSFRCALLALEADDVFTAILQVCIH